MSGGLGLRDPRSVLVFDGKAALGRVDILEQRTETNSRALHSLIELLDQHTGTVNESALLIQELSARVAALESNGNGAESAPREPLPIPENLAELSWGDFQKVARLHGLRGKREETTKALEALRGGTG